MFNFAELVHVLLRAVIAIIVLFAVTRMLGKKQIGQLTFYDYVVGITIGGIAADAIITIDTQFINGMGAIILFGLISLALSYLSIKSFRANRFFNGAPIILIEDGHFMMDHFAKIKLPIFKFIEECRKLNCFDVSEIQYAIMETTGKLSILLKEDYQPVTKKDISKKSSRSKYFYSVIIDGKVITDNLKKAGKTEEWLYENLKKQKVKSTDHIALATLNKNGQLHIFPAEKEM